MHDIKSAQEAGSTSAQQARHLAEILEEELTGQPAAPGLSEASQQECDNRLRGIFARIHALPPGRAALCLSGGGIRSASFGLGVLQALARKRVLGEFDLLSTVSGGGYIGAWLSAWIRNHRDGREMVLSLLREAPDDPSDPEWKPIRHLRTFSNYLTPKLGLFSADTWTLVATVLRNIFLNWLVLISWFAICLIIPRLFVAVAYSTVPASILPLLLWGGFAGFAVSIFYAVADLPQGGNARWSEDRFILLRLVPLAMGAILLCTWWAQRRNLDPAGAMGWIAQPERAKDFALFCVASAFSGSAGGALYACCRPARKSAKVPPVSRRRLFEVVFAATITAALGGVVFWLMARNFPEPVRHVRLYVCLAPPLVLATFLFFDFLLTGLSSFSTEDEDREWWGRSGGWILLFILGWTVWTALALFGPDLIGWIKDEHLRKTVAAIASTVVGIFTAIKGLSARTPAQSDAAASPQWPLVAATLAFFLCLSIALGAVFGHPRELWLAVGVDMKKVGLLLAWCGVLAAISGFMGWFVNINKFSLHGMYRSRIIRAFLGASRTAKQELSMPREEGGKGPVQPRLNPHSIRSEHPFTGFDPEDNMPLHTLSPEKPLHVINMALNLVSGEELAWQERKAASFTASRLHCGSWQLGYRTTSSYGGAKGISLGTAVAISGAAASPNMGYHSSPLVTLLMTIFNARLGWWLGNPGKVGGKTWQLAGPRFALLPLLAEATGRTNASYPYVHLSDGGHFENLGIYEMVLRRSRFIIAIDGGCDPLGHFDDLGNAIRKVRIDLGIPIHIQTAAFSGEKRLRCAYGKIDYWQIDGGGQPDDAKTGHLLYIKPTLCQNEPADVSNYAAAHPEFPHESTGDQFFSESQLESYRALGSHTIDEICPGDFRDPSSQVRGFIRGVLEHYLEVPPDELQAILLQMGFPPSAGSEEI